MIPKVLIQTSKEPYPSEFNRLWFERKSDWEIKWFDDAKIIQYFEENPDPEFPNIVAVFDSFSGPHKSDLFRYYYLYKNGGIYIDYDMCLVDDLGKLHLDISRYDCFLCLSDKLPMNVWLNKVKFNIDITTTIFNGFIGCESGNKIIYEALKHAYTTSPEKLKNHYHYFVESLYNIYDNFKDDNMKIKWYYERHDIPDGFFEKESVIFENVTKYINICDANMNEVVGCHFFLDKKLDENVLNSFKKENHK